MSGNLIIDSLNVFLQLNSIEILATIASSFDSSLLRINHSSQFCILSGKELLEVFVIVSHLTNRPFFQDLLSFSLILQVLTLAGRYCALSLDILSVDWSL
jgi:hypothetical protein